MTDAERQANAERVARWREQHIKSVDGEKERLTLVLDVGTKARLLRLSVDHYATGVVGDADRF